MGGWAEPQVEADLKVNLAIIREAVGDPHLPCPTSALPTGAGVGPVPWRPRSGCSPSVWAT